MTPPFIYPSATPGAHLLPTWAPSHHTLFAPSIHLSLTQIIKIPSPHTCLSPWVRGHLTLAQLSVARVAILAGACPLPRSYLGTVGIG